MYVRLVWVILAIIVGINGYARIPVAVSTKFSGTCEIQSNGNAASIILCAQYQIKIIERCIDYNLRYAPLAMKKEWKTLQKKIFKRCGAKNSDLSDPFNSASYAACVRDEYSQFNRILLNTKKRGFL